MPLDCAFWKALEGGPQTVTIEQPAPGAAAAGGQQQQGQAPGRVGGHSQGSDHDKKKKGGKGGSGLCPRIRFRGAPLVVDWVGKPSAAKPGEQLTFADVQPDLGGVCTLSDGSRFHNPALQFVPDLFYDTENSTVCPKYV